MSHVTTNHIPIALEYLDHPQSLTSQNNRAGVAARQRAKRRLFFRFNTTSWSQGRLRSPAQRARG